MKNEQEVPAVSKLGKNVLVTEAWGLILSICASSQSRISGQQ